MHSPARSCNTNVLDLDDIACTTSSDHLVTTVDHVHQASHVAMLVQPSDHWLRLDPDLALLCKSEKSVHVRPCHH
jgi:hypothetical protein